MKTKAIFLLLVAFTFATISTALAGNTFKIGLYGLESESVRQLQQTHPELTLSSDVPPNTTDRLIQSLLTGSFDYDVFPLVTSICDVKTIVNKA